MINTIKLSKEFLTLFILIIVTGCGGSSKNSTPHPTATGTISVAQSGTLITNTKSTYYIPVTLTSETTATIKSIYITDLNGNDSLIFSSSKSCINTTLTPTNPTCYISVTVDGDKIRNDSNLQAKLNINFIDGNHISTPLATLIQQVQSNNGTVIISSPSKIINNDGNVNIMMTAFNSGSTESFSIDPKSIIQNGASNLSWKFAVNCDGAGGNTINTGASCSIYATAKANSITKKLKNTLDNNVTFAMQVVNTTSNKTQNISVTSSIVEEFSNTPSTIITSPVSGVTLIGDNPAEFYIKNSGNATITEITISNLPNLVTYNVTPMSDNVYIITLNNPNKTQIPPTSYFTVTGKSST